MSYSDLTDYLALPRTSGLALSADGTRLVTSVATLDPKGTAYVTALWEVDPTGQAPARRLTRSRKGESGPVFAPDGSVLFVSVRPDPETTDSDDDLPSALWVLPPVGEARVAGTRPGGLSAVTVARDAPTVLALSDTLPGSGDGESDEQRRTARKDAKVTAVLHGGYPVRYWDRDLGVGQNRLLAGDLAPDGTITWRDLTPEPGRALHEASIDVTRDGRTAVTSWLVAEPRGSRRTALVAVTPRRGSAARSSTTAAARSPLRASAPTAPASPPSGRRGPRRPTRTTCDWSSCRWTARTTRSRSRPVGTAG